MLVVCFLVLIVNACYGTLKRLKKEKETFDNNNNCCYTINEEVNAWIRY